MVSGVSEVPTPGAIAGVLRTRLLPPRLPPGCVRRHGLIERIHEGLRGRLVAIVAGAGYGKTTVLVQALQELDVPWVWISCDERVRTPKLLISHVLAGLADRFPGVGTGVGLNGSVEDQIAQVANEVASTVGDDFILAFDDVHCLDAEAVLPALSQLSRDLPPNVHLAMASRQALRLPGALLAPGGTTEIDERSLVFSYDETVALLGEEDGAANGVSELHDATEGWVSGLLLASRPGGGAAPRPRVDAAPHFDYLAAEVVAGLPADLRAFLLDTAVLDRFTPELAGTVASRPDARAVIARLLDEHLFITRLSAAGEWYRYHHLFTAFLRGLLEREGPERVSAAHRGAAEAWLAIGDHQEAVSHYLEINAHAEAAAALEPIAEALVPTAEAANLVGWLARIPQPIWERRPGIKLAYALMQYLRGRPREAFAAWDEAIEALIAAGAHARASAATYRFHQAMITAGTRPRLRIDSGERLISRLEDDGPALALVRLMLGIGYAHACQPAEATRQFERALAVASPDEALMMEPLIDALEAFYMDYPAGRITTSLGRIDAALAQLEMIETTEASMLRAFVEGYRAAIHADCGRARQALEEADGVLDLSESLGMRAAAEMHATWWRLTALWELERWDELAALAGRVGPGTMSGGMTSFGFRYSAALAAAAAVRGDPQAALAAIATGRAELEAFGDCCDTSLVLCDLSRAASLAGQRGLAVELAEEAHEVAARYGFDWHAARAALLAAAGHGPGPAGDARLAEALELTDRLGLLDLWTRRERGHAAGLLARGIADGLGPPGTAARIAAACGRDVLHATLDGLMDAGAPARAALASAIDEACDVDPETLRELLADPAPEVAAAADRARRILEGRPRPAIRITTFGGLAIHRSGQRVPDSAFGRPKAKVLLAALLCSGERGANRDILLDDLWGGTRPNSRVLDTTLHELRRALEPLMPARARGSLVVKDGESYALRLGPRDWWDADEFRRSARAAIESADLDAMLAAEALWTGDFLPELRDEDWVDASRAELERIRVELLEALAERLLAARRPAAAIDRYQTLVGIDQLRESWHRALMQAYFRAGDRAMALRQFHACRRALKDELAIEPSRATRDLYDRLLSRD